MKIVAFGTSNSKNSINQQFAIYATKKFTGETIEILDLSLIDLPVYSVDKETEHGIPQLVKDFITKIESADLLILSLAEHNGTYTTAFKNIFDWSSRAKQQTFKDTKMLLLSTSPGPRGGLGVMEAAKSRFPFHGADIIGSFSLPNFSTNFDAKKGILDTLLKHTFDEVIENVRALKY